MAAKNYVHHGRNVWHPHHGTGDMDRAIKRECYIHHSAGFFRRHEHVAEMAATMRDIEHFHVATNGWSGIAYNYLVFQPYGKLKKAHIFTGRGARHIPAAQLGHNTGTIAICVVDDPDGERLQPVTEHALAEFVRNLQKRDGVSLRVLGGHRDAPGQSTACPGPRIYPHLSHIAKAAGLKRVQR
jgi:hypothetical protein